MSLICGRILWDSALSKRVNFRAITTGFSYLRNQAADTGADGGGQRGSISKAMQSYIERAKQHTDFMKEQQEEFRLGRRHLANMMGKDPETFSQDDINEAIRYLFPSGLFQTSARPMMKPPEEVYPRKKAAQFDPSGRPHHPFFYTARPNFYFLMHEIVNKINKLNNISAPAPEPTEEMTGFINGTVWITKEKLEDIIFEKLSDKLYSDWLSTMERIVSHTHYDKELEFLKEYRIPLARRGLGTEDVTVTLLPDGRKSAFVKSVKKRKCRGSVTVTMPGTGEILTNGKDLEFYQTTLARENIIAPLQKARWLGRVDVDARLEGPPGESTWSHAVRHGIAMGIVALGAEAEPLRLSGYLTHDRRSKERKKPGRTSARKKWTWKKR